MFPRYVVESELRANSASAALNKWLKMNINSSLVVHSLRHSIRDRLRKVECPAAIIDAICGWSTPGVGESYGVGYDLNTKHKWLHAVATY